MNRKKKIYYFCLNLLAPGIAQIVLKRWLRGIFELGAALFFTGWAAWEILRPLIVTINNFIIHDGENAEIVDINLIYFIRISIPVILLAAIWILSYIDLMVIMEQNAKNMKGTVIRRGGFIKETTETTEE